LAAEHVPSDTLLSLEAASLARVSVIPGNPLLLLKASWLRRVLNGRVVPPFQGWKAFWSVNPGRRSRCSLAPGYFLSGHQPF
jgi:hypothetical protein